jgi:preprotein translocase subunit SecF
MKRKTYFMVFFSMILISLGFFAFNGFGRDQQFENKANINMISEKVNEVLKNQKDIIERLKDIRSQQDIIRVRASQR